MFSESERKQAADIQRLMREQLIRDFKNKVDEVMAMGRPEKQWWEELYSSDRSQFTLGSWWSMANKGPCAFDLDRRNGFCEIARSHCKVTVEHPDGTKTEFSDCFVIQDGSNFTIRRGSQPLGGYEVATNCKFFVKHEPKYVVANTNDINGIVELPSEKDSSGVCRCNIMAGCTCGVFQREQEAKNG